MCAPAPALADTLTWLACAAAVDEPTSGLDATSAQMVGDTLRRMSATDGTSSCTTIHQPRASLLAVFDTLLLLAEGRVMYFGPTGLRSVSDGAGVLEYFKAAGYSCPPMENPADWLLDLMQCADGADGADVEIGVSRARLAQSFADTYAASPLASAAMVPLKSPPSPLPPIGKGTTLFPTSWAMQFAVLWRRTMLYKLREPAAVMTQFSMAVIMPLLVGGIFWGITNSQAAVSDRLAAVSFLILLQSFMCMDQILLFPKERAVYLRDHAVGLHSTSSFFVARSLAEMPFILLFAAISATISYWCGSLGRCVALLHGPRGRAGCLWAVCLHAGRVPARAAWRCCTAHR
jgi:ATP-binding cassette subfamily G (WHITE) protein 2